MTVTEFLVESSSSVFHPVKAENNCLSSVSFENKIPFEQNKNTLKIRLNKIPFRSCEMNGCP